MNAGINHTNICKGMLMYGVISDEDDEIYNIDCGIKNFKLIMNKDLVKNTK